MAEPRRVARRRWVRMGIAVSGLVGALSAGGLAAVYFLNYWPRPVEAAAVECGTGVLGGLDPGREVSVLSWNIQYGASRKYHFFYDGGRAVRVSCRDVHETLAGMVRFVASLDPDVLFLQEVDRDSDRTCRIDEMAPFRRELPGRCWTWATYHRSRYVPVPLHEPLGRVDMNLVTGSRFRIESSRRHALPLLRENFLRRAFNLKRAVLVSWLSLEGGGFLVLLNTHLSAFSFGDGTLQRQVDRLCHLLDDLERRNVAWVLAGDFNMLPPGDDPSRLGSEARYYGDQGNPIRKLFTRYRSAMDLDAFAREPSRFYTYLPFGAKAPNRTLDYIFVSSHVEVVDFRVVAPDPDLSDHRALWAKVRVRAPGAPGRDTDRD